MTLQNQIQYIRFLVIVIILSQIGSGCQSGKKSGVSDYRLQLGNFESIIQSGNWFKFKTNRRAEPYTGTLNPGRMISAGRTYHILKFENRDHTLPYNLENGDSLHLILDGRALILTGYNTSSEKDRLSAYYEIDRWDLVDIGNASKVAIIIKAQGGDLRATFSKDNIYNYRYFAAKYILGTEDVPPPTDPAYEQPWAFIGGGVGSGSEFWIGYYTNFFKLKSGVSDFLAAGMGMEKFNYSRYNYFSGKGYLWDGSSSLNNYYINLMYGLTHPSPYGDWSFELGLTYQYFFYDEQWNDKNLGTDRYPTIYRLTDGNPYQGSVIGAFLQVGGFWARINANKNWAVGIAIPMPWW